MTVDPAFRFRHELKTFLNHISGYSEILGEDSREISRPDFAGFFDSIHEKSLKIRRSVTESLRGSIADPSSFKYGIFSSLYEVISVLQKAKCLAISGGKKEFLPDIQKMLEAANGIIGLFDEEETGYQDPSDEESARRRRSSLTENTELKAKIGGRILVVDDNQFNRDLMIRYLERQGHLVCSAENGSEALEMLRKAPFDIVILDVMMPGLNGYQVLESIKGEQVLRETPVIVVSALDEPGSMARCIELGAEDYMPREFDPIILKARIDSCLEKKKIKLERELAVSAIMNTQNRISTELSEAAEYVKSLLPPPLHTDSLEADWIFVPSLSLGGDVFGYHKLGGGNWAMYLIDVSGHGIEAALVSVTLLNMLKTQALSEADYSEPSSVLGALNRVFKIEEQNNMYFTIWYGIWDPEKREIRYSAAGSPPGLLFSETKGKQPKMLRLRSEGIIIGVDPSAIYATSSVHVRSGSRFVLFSDGAFEARRESRKMIGLADFEKILVASSKEGEPAGSCIAKAMGTVEGLIGGKGFEDDVSLIEFRFP